MSAAPNKIDSIRLPKNLMEVAALNALSNEVGPQAIDKARRLLKDMTLQEVKEMVRAAAHSQSAGECSDRVAIFAIAGLMMLASDALMLLHDGDANGGAS